MQQYIIYAWDGTDPDAMERRMKARPHHFQSAKTLKENGNFIIGGAILDDTGAMKGSMMVVQFNSRKDLDDWMNNEPYVTGNVWKNIDVRAFKVADV